MSLWPVYMPSKGRATTARVPPNCSVTLVVEPQDADAYRQAHPEVTQVQLPRNDPGFGGMRQWLLEYAQATHGDWYWMLDDDIMGWYEVVNKRCCPISAYEALSAAQRVVEEAPTVAQLALEYQQFAWSATKPVAWNSYADVCVAIHAGRVGFCCFDPSVTVKTDRDFTLQLIAAGLDVLRVTHVAFGSVPNGTNAGGLSPVYAAGAEAEAVDRMVAKWPGWCSRQVKANGRIDVKMHWARVASRVLEG